MPLQAGRQHTYLQDGVDSLLCERTIIDLLRQGLGTLIRDENKVVGCLVTCYLEDVVTHMLLQLRLSLSLLERALRFIYPLCWLSRYSPVNTAYKGGRRGESNSQ